jgi:hypothetical protein
MKLYKENGQLSDHGKMIFDECLKVGIGKLLHSTNDVNEVRLLGSLMAAYLGDKVCDKILSLKK